MSLRDRLNQAGKKNDAYPKAPTGKPLSSSGAPGLSSGGLKPPPVDEPADRPYDTLKSRVHNKLVEGLSMASMQQMADHELALAAFQLLEKTLAEESIPMSVGERERLVKELIEDITGFGPIEPLLHDESISEIMVNGPRRVYIERQGKLELSSVKFRDDAHLIHVIERIVSLVGRRVDEKNPMVDARLKAPGKPYDGSRFNAIIPPLALDGPSVTIRKFKKDAGTLDKLLGWDSLTPMMAELLKLAVKSHLNIVISGGTGSGKTTMLNSLSALIEQTERIVTIEDAAELQMQQPHVVRLESRPPNIEGEGAIPIRKLLMNSLRMRPDRIIVGECRGGETLDMLQAMNTGHDGSLTTLHANTPRDALSRIETMCLMNDHTLPEKAIRQQVSGAIHLIIQVNRMSDGSRKTTSITEITGMEGDTITLQEIFKYVQTGIDENGKIHGYHTATGVRPRFAEHLAAKGLAIPEGMFDPSDNSSANTSKKNETTTTPVNAFSQAVKATESSTPLSTSDRLRQKLR